MPKYIADPNDSNTQIPGPLPENHLGGASNPSQFVFTKSPSYVVVNTLMTTPCSFYFGSSASFSDLGASGRTNPVNFTKMGDDLAAGTILHIHPTAWSGSKADHDAGVVTFVYASGLTPQRP